VIWVGGYAAGMRLNWLGRRRRASWLMLATGWGNTLIPAAFLGASTGVYLFLILVPMLGVLMSGPDDRLYPLVVIGFGAIAFAVMPIWFDQPPDVLRGSTVETVLFADLVDSTRLSERLSADELVALLDRIFSHFDDLVDQFGLEKIATIGDCYLAVAGMPVPRPDHAVAAAETALAMRAALGQLQRPGDPPLGMRFGLSSGPVVAGVIGKRKFRYDLWGDTVNIASRMQTHGQPGMSRRLRGGHRPPIVPPGKFSRSRVHPSRYPPALWTTFASLCTAPPTSSLITGRV
ncbi:MAG: adenylate/guanylate cyclase domain-containing protein, partial [Acidimicrobiia bacterium]